MTASFTLPRRCSLAATLTRLALACALLLGLAANAFAADPPNSIVNPPPGKRVDLYYQGLRNVLPARLVIPDPASVEQVYVEVVYKGKLPATSLHGALTVTKADGSEVLLEPKLTSGSWGQNGVGVFGATVGKTSRVRLDFEVEEASAQSVLLYVLRGDGDPTVYQAGTYANFYGYNTTEEFTVPLRAGGGGNRQQDITVTIPVTEITTDGRVLDFDISAGGVRKTFRRAWNPGFDFDNECCIDSVRAVLRGVPGTASGVSVKVTSPPSNGQSFVVSGVVQASVRATCSPLALTLPTDICTDNTVVVECASPGAGYEATWDFGPGANPRTYTGFGEVFVMFAEEGRQEIKVSVSGPGCSSEEVHYVNVTACNTSNCALEGARVVQHPAYGNTDGVIELNMCVSCGSTPPYTVFYTYRGERKQRGPINENFPKLRDLAAGTYSDIYVIDANGCQTNVTGPVTLCNGGCDGARTCPDQSCTLTGFYDGGRKRSFWLLGLGFGETRWRWEDGTGRLSVTGPATASITGRIVSVEDPSCGFAVDMRLANRKNWAQWSGLGRSWKGNRTRLADGQHETWDYYELVADQSTLTGFGCFAGTLKLSPRPADFTYGVQVGEGANDQNLSPGLSAWFAYSGTLNGNPINGEGDINAEGTCRIADLRANATPIISCAPDYAVPCGGDPDDAPRPAVNCGDPDAYTLTSADREIGGTPRKIERTWTASGPGGPATCTQVLTFGDDVPPVFSQVPTADQMTCGDVREQTATATDQCGGVTVEFRETRFNERCAGSYDLRRVWTATDESGNTATAELIVHVVDATGPTFLAAPGDLVIECKGDLPTDQPVTADDCGGNVSIDYEATDCQAATPIYTWRDGDLAYLTEGPDPGLSYPAGMRALDFWNACSDAPAQRKRWRVYNPNDFDVYVDRVAAGGRDQYRGITVPARGEVFFFTPAGAGGDAELFYRDDAGAERRMAKTASADQCDLSDAETCTCVYVRRWTATDDCGNASVYEQKVYQRDTEAPTIRNIAADRTFAAGAAIPPAGSVTATDGCTDAALLTEEITVPSADYGCDEAAVHYLFGYRAVSMPLLRLNGRHFRIGDQPLALQERCDGTALLTGVVVDAADPRARFAVSVALAERRTFAEHTAAGGAAPSGCAQADKNAWRFYRIAAGGSRLTGQGSVAGVVLDVSAFAGDPWVQIGPGAARANCKLGVYGRLAFSTASGTYRGNAGTLQSAMSSVHFEATEACEASYTLIRVFSAVDDCGNRAIERQVIRVVDETAPELAGVPDNRTVDCADALPPADVTAVDGADGAVAVTLDEQDGGDACDRTVTRTWTARDACGNEATARQVITVRDEVAPVITFTSPLLSALNPGDLLTVSCSDVPTIDMTVARATDNCDPAPALAFADVKLGEGDCAADGYRERYRCTWTATDRCGNESAFSIFVEFRDDEAPSFAQVPAATRQSCSQPLPTAAPVPSDNCSADPSVRETQTVRPGACPDSYEVVRLWTASDECGNTATASQVVTVVDDVAPALAGVPADVRLTCDEAVPTARPTVSDNCDADVRLVETTERRDGPTGCADHYTLIRLWTATDNCGNVATASQTVVVEDRGAPTLTFAGARLAGLADGAELEAPCDDVPLFTPGDVVAADDCDARPTVTFADELLGEGDCAADGYVRLFRCTWTATDACGNEARLSIRLRVVDEAAPRIANVPGDITIGCDQDLPTSQPVIDDNCTDAAALAITETTERESGSCADAYRLIRVWTAVDRCGNSASARQVVTVEDRIRPVLAQVPESITLSCADALPQNLPTATDNCDADVSVSADEERRGDGCAGSFTLVRTFTATDNCGNTATASQVVTVRDRGAPVFAQVPAATTVSCAAAVPTDRPTANDDCDGDVAIAETTERRPGACPDAYEVVRTWTATDDCGNTTTASQVVTVEDREAPVLAALPQNATVRCDQDLPTDRPTATDNCDADVNVSETQQTRPGACANTYEVVRLFTATDNCGNTATASQVVSVVDEVAPVFASVPANVSIDCDAALPVALPSASDNCDGQVAVTERQETRPGNCAGAYQVIRTFVAVDKCGNEATASQVVSVADDEAPAFAYVPAETSIGCSSDLPNEAARATDNCDDAVEVTERQTTLAGACAGTYDVVRTWTATDHCGNAATASQVVHVSDDVAPAFADVPTDARIGCDEALPTAAPTATDDCDAQVRVDATEERRPGACADSYVVIRRWTATDHCGNATTVSQVVTVDDQTAPAFTVVPADIAIACSQDLPTDAAAATDNCDADVAVVETQRTEPGACANAYRLVRTWTATDNCGNAATATQVVTVEDREAPVFAGVPAAVTVACDEPLPSVGPQVSDNCDADVAINETQQTRPGACADAYEVVRTWTATDDCGNAATASQVVTVQDVSAPTFAFVPAEVTIGCDDALPADQPEVSDNCDATVTVSERAETRPGACAGAYTLTRIWTATDDCGNVATARQIVDVRDEVAPTFANVPQATTVSCDEALPTTQPIVTDNCDDSPRTTEAQRTEPGACPGTYTVVRTWTATDDCGNVSTAEQRVAVEDAEAPAFTSVPAAVTLSCTEAVPTVLAQASDNCDASVVVTETQARQPGACPGAYTVVRTFTATDNCGNVATASQVVTFQDNQAPTFAQVPAAVTVECDADLPTGAPIATDDCDDAVAIAETQRTEPGGCTDGYRVVRIWTATDHCGNTATASQVVTVEDSTPPIFATVPAELTVACDADLPTELATATDNCDDQVAVSVRERTEPGACTHSYLVVRTFTATDNCGNTSTAEQRVRVVDEEAPTFASVPAAVTIGCDDALPVEPATAQDNCDTQVTITESQRTEPGACADSYTVVRTFTATDDCGNAATAEQAIEVIDDAAPVFGGVPADVTIACDAPLPTDAPVATDACDAQVTVTEERRTEPGACADSYTVVRVWTAVDNCGNAATAQQRVTLVDEVPPTLTDLPADVTVACDAPLPTDLPRATDDCDDAVPVSEAQTTNPGACPGAHEVVRVFTATDGCGNTATASQVVTVEDTAPPVFADVPAEVTIGCDKDLPTDSPTASDTCDDAVEIAEDQEFLPGECGGSYRVVRTWTATDDCGNAATATQLVRIEDTVAPAFADVPTDLTIGCGEALPADLPTATDNCDDGVHVAETQQRLPGGCADSYTLVRTFTATDDCGNTATAQQSVTVVDEGAPALVGVPADVDLECDADLPTDTPTATDGCDDEVTVTEAQTTVPGMCGDAFEVVRTWTATDNCGNTATASQVVRFGDSQAPTFANVPAGVTVSCDGELPTDRPTAIDNCDAAVSIEETRETVNGRCADAYAVIRMWTATDACGNAATATQRVEVVDEVAPRFTNVPTDVAIGCHEPLPTSQPAATDNCSAEVTITERTDRDRGACGDSYAVTRIWTATDACGNTATASQVVTVSDDEAPVFAAVPASVTIECADAVPDAEPTATDNCDAEVRVTREQRREDGPCDDSYALVRTWTASDDCGNTATASQVITVIDPNAPTFASVPPAVTISCRESMPTSAPRAADDCDADVQIEETQETLPGPCPDSYEVVRTWTIADNCGNTARATQLVTVIDSGAPTFMSVPASRTVACDEDPGDEEPVATDDCDDAVAITATETTNGEDCATGITLTRIWTATDNCGNTATASQVITFEDAEAPTFGPMDRTLTVECDQPVPLIYPTATDNCDRDVDILHFDNREDKPCGATVTRTWVASDACGNTTSATQLIVIVDSQEPVLAGVPPSLQLNCDELIPPAVVTATDNCTPEVFVELEEFEEPGDCPGERVITRIWTAIDDCDNAAVAEQTITVTDGGAPAFADVPAPTQIGCAEALPTALPTVSDNCGGPTTVEIVETQRTETGNCAGSYRVIRVFTATDACGNAMTATQAVQVVDDEAPSFADVPADVSLACGAALPGAEAIATDACDDAVAVTLREETVAGPCDDTYEVVRTWTAVDHCGNTATARQVVSFADDVAPTFTTVPPDAEVSCNEPLPDEDAYAEDDCDEDVEIGMTEERVPGATDREYAIVRTWTALDNCGNTATAQQTIRVVSEGEPTFTFVPEDIVLACDQNIPSAAARATDVCDGALEPTLAEERRDGACANAYEIVRTWTARDSDGNTATARQTITVRDGLAPSFDRVPADVTLTCGATAPTELATATDDCDPAVSVVVDEQRRGGACGGSYQLVRTFTATDACGNARTAEQVVTFSDDTAPEFTFVPASEEYQCAVGQPRERAQATDDCTGEVVVTFADVSPSSDCSQRLQRVWTATDACGNTATAVQQILLEDTEDPVLVGVPANASVDLTAGGTVPAAAPVTASDNCDSAPNVTLEETTQPASGCGYVLVRTWTALDRCGNTARATQRLAVVDDLGARIEVVPSEDCAPAGIELRAVPAAPGARYAWSSSGGTFDDATSATPTFRPAGAGAYTVTLEVQGADCTGTATATVSVEGASLSVTGGGAVCLGGSTELAASEGADTYRWTGPNGFVATGRVANLRDVAQASAGVYTLVADFGSCSQEATVTVEVAAELTLDVAVPELVCEGSTLELAAGGATDATWTLPDGQTLTGATVRVGPVEFAAHNGAWTVVGEANGCVADASIDVRVVRRPVVNAGVNEPICVGNPIELFASGAARYSWTGPNGFASSEVDPVITDVAGFAAGSYEFRVVGTSVGGCTDEQTVQVVIGSGGSAGLTVSVPSVACQDAPLELSASGAEAYVWSGPNGFASSAATATIPSASMAAAGEYELVADFADGCTATRTFTIEVVEDFAKDAVVRAETCAAKGSIELNLPGDPAAYTIEWDDLGAARGPQTRTALDAGSYVVTVTTVACSETYTFRVEDACRPGSSNCELAEEAEIARTSPTCGAADGAIAYPGDAAGLRFDWVPNVSTTQEATGLATGFYRLTVTSVDDPTCTRTYGVALSNTGAPSAELSETRPADCANSTGFARLAPASLTYNWNDGFVGATRDNMAPGTYGVTFRDPATNCRGVLGVVIEIDNTLEASVTVLAQPTCGDRNGAARVDVASGSGNYTYSWGGGATRSDLASGAQSVTVVDNATGCTRELPFTLVDGAAGSNAIAVGDVDADCGSRARANPQTTLDPDFAQPATTRIETLAGARVPADDLPGGTLVAVLSDANGCDVARDTFAVRFGGSLTAATDVTGAACDAGGTVTVVPSDTGAFTLSWTDLGGPPTDELSRGDLEPGDYEFTLRDGRGCSLTQTVTVPDACNCEATNSIIRATQVDVCLTAGTAEVSIVQVTAPTVPPGYGEVYLLADVATGRILQTDDQEGAFTVDAVRTYSIHQLVYDSVALAQNVFAAGRTIASVEAELVQGGGGVCGALTTFGARITAAECCVAPEVISVVTTDADCGAQNGAANVQVFGDAGDFVYVWSPDRGTASGQAGNVRVSLPIGTYEVRVVNRADASCFTTATAVVGAKQIDAGFATVTAATCGATDGTARFAAAAPGLTFAWSDGGTGAQRDDLAAGSYVVTVTDGATPDCEERIAVEVPELADLQLTARVNAQPQCGAADGSVTIGVGAGSGSYAFDWGGGARRDDLASGLYSVTVTDQATGCSDVVTFTLEDQVVGGVQIDVSDVELRCNGAADGTPQFALDYSDDFRFPPQVTFVDRDGDVVTFGELGPGEYCVLIRDADGCLAGSECFAVTEPDALQVSVRATDAGCDDNGAIVLDVAGGTPPYNFDWADLPAADDPRDRAGLNQGQYTVFITDANGCASTVNAIAIGRDCGCSPTLPTLAPFGEAVCLGDEQVLVGTRVLAAPTRPDQAVAYLLSDAAGVVQGVATTPMFWIDAAGDYAVHGLVYEPLSFNTAAIVIGTTTISDLNAQFVQGNGFVCAGLDLAGVGVEVTACPGCDVAVGSLTTTTATVACTDDGLPNALRFAAGATRGALTFVLVDAAGAVVRASADGNFDAEGLTAGRYRVYALATRTAAEAPAVGAALLPRTGCFDLSQGIEVRALNGPDCVGGCQVSGGVISDFAPATLCVRDLPAAVRVSASGLTGSRTAYVVTTMSGSIVDVQDADGSLEVNTTMLGQYLVYALAYDDPLTGLSAGRDLDNLDGCFALSAPQPLTVADGAACGQAPTPDTVRLTVLVLDTERACFVLDAGFDARTTTYALSGGTGSAGQSAFGTYVLGTDGCLSYTAGSTAGIDVDFVTVTASDGGQRDVTVFAVTIVTRTPSEEVVLVDVPADGRATACPNDVPALFTAPTATLSTGGTRGASLYGDYAVDATTGCLTYDANAFTGRGIDTVVVVVCDAALNRCHEVTYVISVLPQGDRLARDVLQGDTLVLCPPTGLLFGTAGTPTLCALPTRGTATLDAATGCFVYEAPADYVGPDSLCIEVCDATGLCVQRVVAITVLPACGDIVPDAAVGLNVPDCDSFAVYCLPIAVSDVADYALTLDGTPYRNTATACGGGAGTSVFVDTGAHVLTLRDLRTGCADTVVISVGCADCGLSQTPDVIELDDCDERANITLGLLAGNWDAYTFTLDGVDARSLLVAAGPRTLIPVDTGAHRLIVRAVDNSCQEVIDVTVVCDGGAGGGRLVRTVRQSFTDTVCLSALSLALPGPYVSVEDTCPGAGAGGEASLDYDAAAECFSYTGLLPGVDSLCLEICNAAGRCETVAFTVTVVPPGTTEEDFDIEVGEAGRFCIDTTELASPITEVFNFCPEPAGSAVAFVLDEEAYCVDYEGIAEGTARGCFVICNPVTCDTVFVNVAVRPAGGNLVPPVAVDDGEATTKGMPVDVNVLRNDTLNGPLEEVRPIDLPRNGNLLVVGDSTVRYTPDLNFCGAVDSFRYVISNGVARDTATVRIEVTCDELVVFSGFSPNGDGVNDLWRIVGIEAYPGNRVVIFNRWGNEVYSRDDYSNAPGDAFEGRWDGKTLPDGTYFYVIDLGGDEGCRSGYLQIQR